MRLRTNLFHNFSGIKLKPNFVLVSVKIGWERGSVHPNSILQFSDVRNTAPQLKPKQCYRGDGIWGETGKGERSNSLLKRGYLWARVAYREKSHGVTFGFLVGENSQRSRLINQRRHCLDRCGRRLFCLVAVSEDRRINGRTRANDGTKKVWDAISLASEQQPYGYARSQCGGEPKYVEHFHALNHAAHRAWAQGGVA